jgi:cholesterol oxidase
VLSAGVFGSTFLFLKSRAAFPKVDANVLGRGFSGNGDLLTLLIKAKGSEGRGPGILEASYGPVISSYIHVPYRRGKQRGHYVEDAGYPYLVSWLAELTTLPWWAKRWLRLRRRLAVRKLLGRSQDTDIGAEFADLIGDAVLSSSSMPMLGMGRDVPAGHLRLDGEGRLTSDWTIDPSSGYFRELEATARGIAAELGGEFRDSRIRHISRLVTVHPLGGLRMGRSADEGVVDSYGHVFGYENFVVADGSVMPGPVGPNPSLTIAALANRSADRMLGKA